MIDDYRRGDTGAAISERYSVSIRTVWYVLARWRRYGRPFRTITRVCNEHISPVHRRPHGARRWLTINLHWRRWIADDLARLTNRRLISVRKRQLGALRRESRHYLAAVSRADGADKARAVQRSSERWLDDLAGLTAIERLTVLRGLID